jgi:hypothetical protein
MTITESQTAHRTAVFAGMDPAETPTQAGAHPRAREDNTPETTLPGAETAPKTTTHRSRGWLARLVDRLTPPEPWQYRPSSLAARWRYARRGGWTGPAGPARRLYTWWYRLVTFPVTLVCHYASWVVARVSRTIAVAVLWALLMQARPLRTLADAVLPWPVWPWGGAS